MSRAFIPFFVFLLIDLSGCSTSRPQPGPVDSPGIESPGVQGPPVPFGPQPPASDLPAGATFGPDPVATHPLVLVLSTGGARGFAHAGVFRVLAKEKIPVRAIYATDVGALVAALYSLHGNANYLEWGLQRFKDEIFNRERSLMDRLIKREPSASPLAVELNRAFGNQEFKDLKIPLFIALPSPGEPNYRLIHEGLVRSVVETAIRSVGTTPVAEARASAVGPVVVIDVTSGRGRVEEDKADLLIRPDLTGIQATDFSKRTEAIFRGGEAVRAHRQELKTLVGQP